MKNNIAMVVAGVCIGITACYILWFYQISNTVVVDHANLNVIIGMIQKGNAQSTPPVTK